MFQPILFLLNTKRQNKRIISLIYDICAIVFSLYLAIALRTDTLVFQIGKSDIACLVVTTSVTIFCFIRLGMYRAVLRYMILPAIGHIFFAIILSAVTIALSGFFFQTFVPRSVPFIYAGLAILTIGVPRVLIKTLYYHYYKRQKPNVFIYGAGATGRDLAYALIQGDEYHPVVFLDDDSKKVGQILTGVRIHHSSEFDKLRTLYQPIKLLLAITNINKGERLRLVEHLSSLPIEVQSVPSVEDIAAGKASATDLRDLDISDLLGRAPIEPNIELLTKNIDGKSVLVTGAGGSIGSELCRQIIILYPCTLVLFELNEFNLYTIHQELISIKNHFKIDTDIIAMLGSVEKEKLLTRLMETNKIETVYHAAAYKHVPIVENNIIEGIQNNVFGTLACANAAITSGVSNFTLISTDKAVRPTNVMGASKRMAELVLQALADKETDTTLTMVRFGNVLGSSGSVVPLFKEQIRKGGPVTVTHPDITRYFMLISEAAQLVIQAGAMGKNGQVFVLDMGEAVKIIDLAKRMINLMGLMSHIEGSNDEGDIEIKFTGLRSGEKLYEELLIGNNVLGSSHPKVMTACEDKLSWDEMEKTLTLLKKYCRDFNEEEIKNVLLSLPIGYTNNASLH
ncbi:polysaccharide biosynthesis protein [Candidatus Enterovibrio escicola]|uniref:polysaccharide biosynthesis protein n=2 Tax=Candidatus Enterovibrio escicola TaxID=1927127 RepID=UPI0012383446|nr:nucleoside-diphosphate sugar epimerase/dehydratase [Candidatus Enterovibrio escacola]